MKCNFSEGRVLIYLFAILGLLACSSPSSDTLRLSSWVSSPSETELFKATLADFRSQQPELDFVYEPIPW